MPRQMDQQTTPSPSTPSSQALDRPLPQNPFYSVEFPGYVQNSSTQHAIQRLGGQASLDNAFKRSASKGNPLVELSLRPQDPFSHPIPGSVVLTNNILLKVVRRKYKRREGDPDPSVEGEYTIEAVGVIPNTLRFRSMADYQYIPDPNDPITNLRKAMTDMDVDFLSTYTIPQDSSDYMVPTKTSSFNVDSDGDVDMNLDPELRSADEPQLSPAMISNLRLVPPPLFSRQTLPQAYNFKSNPASMVTTVLDEETGEERKRLVNKMRWKGYGPASIMFVDKQVPSKPPATVEEERSQVDPALLIKLQAMFVDRPIWTRMSLLNQFSQAQAREIHNSKLILPLVCYVFQDGPWRDTLVRFNYDPRQNPEARFYQRLYFRNANHPIARPSVTARRQDRASASGHQQAWELNAEKDAERKRSHVFDGKKITKETAAFQLCDIVDPMLKEMIEDEEDLRETCHERDGWYGPQAFERVKTVLRHKFFSLLEGHPITDEECRALLTEGASKSNITTRVQKQRAGKHNMAKGALRPEDAAAVRLRATLDRNAKALQENR